MYGTLTFPLTLLTFYYVQEFVLAIKVQSNKILCIAYASAEVTKLNNRKNHAVYFQSEDNHETRIDKRENKITSSNTS